MTQCSNGMSGTRRFWWGRKAKVHRTNVPENQTANMTNRLIRVGKIGFSIGAVISMCSLAQAQNFAANKGDLMLGFRKTNGASFELVVNIGNVTNFVALAAGTSTNVAGYAPSNVVTASFSSYNLLQWSVTAAFAGSTPWAGFPASTLWFTRARTNVSNQSAAPNRSASGSQQSTRQSVLGIAWGAQTNSLNLGSTNVNNNTQRVREPAGDTSGLTALIGDPSDPTYGDLGATVPFSVECTTPASFSSVVRSDLYQVVPTGSTDPATGLTSGAAYLVGYFQLNTDGTMTFTRATASVAPPPPAPHLTIGRNGNNITVSFPSTNTATYTLLYTNNNGLGSPSTSWAVGASQSGNNSTLTFQDPITPSNRIYRVKAQ